MIPCKSFGNVFADALLIEGYRDKELVFISIIGSEGTVKGASAVILELKPIWFGENAELCLRRSPRFDSFKSQTRKLAPHISHTTILPCDRADSLIIGRTQEEIKDRILRKVQNQIPFLPEWREWLWQWASEETGSYQPIQGHNLMGGWLNINIEDLKQAITGNIGYLKSLLKSN